MGNCLQPKLDGIIKDDTSVQSLSHNDTKNDMNNDAKLNFVNESKLGKFKRKISEIHQRKVSMHEDMVRSKSIDKTNKDDFKKTRNIKRILLLGTKNSGKSTLFKQLLLHCGDLYTEEYRKNTIKKRIHQQLIKSVQVLLTESDYYYNGKAQLLVYGYIRKEIEPLFMDTCVNGVFVHIPKHLIFFLYTFFFDFTFYDNNKSNKDVNEYDTKSAMNICSININTTFNFSLISNDLYNIFHSESIQELFHSSYDTLNIPLTTEYFFNINNYKRICNINYIPNHDDITHLRFSNNKMEEAKIEMKDNTFQICNAAGLIDYNIIKTSNKWIHQFESVTTVLFVVNLACFDEYKYIENDLNDNFIKINIMIHSLNMFEYFINSNYFEDTPFILFLNKKELFNNKIQKIQLNSINEFNDFNEINNYDNGTNYFKNLFLSKCKNTNKQIYPHFTNLTDKDQFLKIFNDVQHIVINSSLTKGGLI